jgi:hypothetical protein
VSPNRPWRLFGLIVYTRAAYKTHYDQVIDLGRAIGHLEERDRSGEVELAQLGEHLRIDGATPARRRPDRHLRLVWGGVA